MTTNEILAYLAGVIDSDGTIGIKRSTYAMRVRKDAGQAVYSERVAVKQVTPEAIDLLKATFGGSRFISKASVAKGRPLHGWQVTDLQAYKCLLAVRPFLRIKGSQADNCIALRAVKEESKIAKVARGRGHVGCASRPAVLTEQMNVLHLNAKALNVVGV